MSDFRSADRARVVRGKSTDGRDRERRPAANRPRHPRRNAHFEQKITNFLEDLRLVFWGSMRFKPISFCGRRRGLNT